jgi:hypothetical protein
LILFPFPFEVIGNASNESTLRVSRNKQLGPIKFGSNVMVEGVKVREVRWSRSFGF